MKCGPKNKSALSQSTAKSSPQPADLPPDSTESVDKEWLILGQMLRNNMKALEDNTPGAVAMQNHVCFRQQKFQSKRALDNHMESHFICPHCQVDMVSHNC